MISNFKELPNELDFSVTYGTSRAKDSEGLPTKKITQLGSSNSWRVTGCGWDTFGGVMGKMITTLFKKYLEEISKDILKDYYGINIFENNLITIDGGCGVSAMEDILTDLLGYKIKYTYKLDRKGRPDYKTGITLTKVEVSGQLFTIQELVDRGDVVNLYTKWKNSPSVTTVYRDDSVDYFLKEYNPNGKFIADKAHSGLYQLRAIPE